jgi:hypothetical protein
MGLGLRPQYLRPEVLQGWLVPHEGAWVGRLASGTASLTPRVSRTCDRPTSGGREESPSVAPYSPASVPLVPDGISPPYLHSFNFFGASS